MTRNADGDVIASVILPPAEAKPIVDTLRGLDTLTFCLNYGANAARILRP